jgi:hypothetical protein
MAWKVQYCTMKTDVTMHIALQECLLPSEVGGLVQVAAERKISPGDLIVLAVREFLRSAQANPTANAQPEEVA